MSDSTPTDNGATERLEPAAAAAGASGAPAAAPSDTPTPPSAATPAGSPTAYPTATPAGSPTAYPTGVSATAAMDPPPAAPVPQTPRQGRRALPVVIASVVAGVVAVALFCSGIGLGYVIARHTGGAPGIERGWSRQGDSAMPQLPSMPDDQNHRGFGGRGDSGPGSGSGSQDQRGDGGSGSQDQRGDGGSGSQDQRGDGRGAQPTPSASGGPTS